MNKRNNNPNKSLLYYLLFIFVIVMVLQVISPSYNVEKEISMSKFLDRLEKGQVKKIVAEGSKFYIMNEQETKGGSDQKKSPQERTVEENTYVYIPGWLQESVINNYLKKDIDSGKIDLTLRKEPQAPWYVEMIPSLLIMLVFLYIFYAMLNRSQGAGGNVSNFGKSRAKLSDDNSKIRITFSDVAGLKEEKEELYEIVDFLKGPKKYTDLGARIPKGVLLVGPPGTGKTYLSRAVAGEAGVPFFSISGSDFVEMFVGVGASRVRDLFSEAKKKSPCIIFIDEIDAVGRKRGAGLGGGHDEREQTLNQLLVEMDGFSGNEGIIIMAATNRPDILDQALLRPGRFDRQVYVGMPDVRERQEVLKIHTKNKRLGDDVDLESIAKNTSGFTPADLENLCNEAALLAARNSMTYISRDIFEEATIKVMAGPAKKSKVIIERERVLTAYHESGHALVSRLLPYSDPVHMISIVPRGRAGGFTAYIPEEDRSYMTKNEIKQRLVSLLGGRAAEELVLKDISTGASNDIERATKLARQMITIYGMSDDLGPISYESSDQQPFVGAEVGNHKGYSDKVQEKIDMEVKETMDEAYETALKLLSDNINVLHALASELLEKETINSDEFEDLFKRYEEGNEEARVHPSLKEVIEEEREEDKILDGEEEKEDEGGEVI